MRSLVLFAVLVSTPAFAALPPLCALPRPAAMPVAGQASLVASLSSIPAHSGGTAAASTRPQPAAPIPAALAGSPFVQHIAAAGATTTDLGEAHGLRGMFVRSGPQFQVFYVAPDGERVIPGVMWDSSGKDLTRSQVAHIPGAIPTVTVGSVSAAISPAASQQNVDALPLVRKASSGTIGPASAPHLWMLIDPQCIYSIRAFQMLQPFAASGRLQLTIIPLSVLDYEDHGQSTRSALALLSKPSNRLVQAWQAGDVSNPPLPQAAERLEANGAIARAIGLRGTPTFVWRKTDGTEGRLDGIPTDVAALVASIGS